ncbi:hypothetical protein GJ699_25635 [Duganella sp. FT80W]|uniref:Lipoprotein n=1 Tax=Duganella guangzhouensis TaxID=2666084 RepID=A0A6I2L9K5_9BURK|nr:hypothetical protein [Duganella guangzhouensis]MRW93376.1 hypothetical protein [Duganella guangzhouensis]
MKFSLVNVIAAVAMVATLAGCGGKAQYVVGGTVTNLNTDGLVLVNNGGNDLTVAAGATSFAFSKEIDYGTTYNITVKTQPAHMTCSVTSGNASAGYNVTIQAAVTCVQNTYTVGGQYSGVTAAADGTARTVTLINGSTGSTATVSSDTATSGDFVLSTYVADGAAYGVTVVTPTNGLTCTLENGTGVMHEAAVTNLLLTCTSQ